MTPTHQEIETHFRRLLEDAELAPPDRVLYEPCSVGFAWDASKVIVWVDFDDDGASDVRSTEVATAA